MVAARGARAGWPTNQESRQRVVSRHWCRNWSSAISRPVWFWCDLLGFQIAYQRPEDEFAYRQRGRAQVMLEVSKGNWQTDEWERPLGRGINFQIVVDSLEPLLDALAIARWPLFRDPHEAWYRIAGHEAGQRQFFVQDPDGYLLPFAQPLGRRAMVPGAGG